MTMREKQSRIGINSRQECGRMKEEKERQRVQVGNMLMLHFQNRFFFPVVVCLSVHLYYNLQRETCPSVEVASYMELIVNPLFRGKECRRKGLTKWRANQSHLPVSINIVHNPCILTGNQ